MGKKQTARNQLDDDFEITGEQTYARSLGPRGNHQHEVELMDGSKTLVTLPPKFRNVVWLKRGHYVIVDPTVGVTEKVGGEIAFVLFPKNIKDLKAAGKWPAQFSEAAPAVSDHEEQESDDDLFVNNNRPIMSSDEDSSEEED